MARWFARLLVGLTGLLALCLTSIVAPPAAAQAPGARDDVPQSCPGLIAQRPPSILRVGFRPAALTAQEVRISYLGHASFLLESPQLVRIVTDYNGYNVPPMTPDIVTMNRAHSSHYTDAPDPRIAHVLRGWSLTPDRPVRHDLQVKDVHVRNVPTNIRTWDGRTERHGNSIFIFEIGDLCIAHLGHLHHTLTQQQLNEIGKVDVVMAPVDGSVTLDVDGMLDVLRALKAPLVIPMHFFSRFTLERFIDRVKETYAIDYAAAPSIVVSRTTLPSKPTLLVLPGH